MKLFAATRVVSWGRAALAVIGASALMASAGFGAGWMARGWHQAQTDLKVERHDSQQAAVERQRQRGIVSDYIARREQIATDFRGLDHEIPAFIAARPDLAGVDLGADGLQLIARWDAAGMGGRGPVAAVSVPDAAAGAEEREP
ncbi:MAG TPA: hypothetical protein PKZ76_03400 [Xanthomonadaceae bacterium]|nr:hypothetical protein [Xanthomonadaceae bacterium]